MARFDFFNKEYNLNEIADGYFSDDFSNFKNDKDFLDFLISYTLGNHLVGEDSENFKEYADYEGLFNIALLDQYDLLGEKLYRIYEICEKDKMKFIRACYHFGTIASFKKLPKEIIEKNISLKNPVNFIDDAVTLSDGTRPIMEFKYLPYGLYGNFNGEQEEEYFYEIERSLRHRINESIKENGDSIELLEEMISYVDKKRKEKEEWETKRVKDDYEINIDNLYYGKEVVDASGGVLGLNMQMVSWFENTNTKLLDYYIFRSVPLGEYCLVDNNGEIHIPKEVLSTGKINIGPKSSIRKVEIVNIPHLFERVIDILEKEQVDNETTILQYKGFYENLVNNKKIRVSDLNQYESIIRKMYEFLNGDMFIREDNNDRNYEEEGPKKL